LAISVFGDAAYADLVVPTAALVVAYTLHVLVYAYLRGSSRPLAFCGLHVAVHGVIPLAVFALRPASAGSALAALAGATLVSSGVAVVAIARRDALALHPAAREAARVLARYGRSRMVAALGLLLLASLPATYVAHAAGMEQAGVVALGLSLIGMAGSAATPIAIALLPAASVHFARRENAARAIANARVLAAALSAFGSLLAFALAPAVAAAFFDADGPRAASVLRVCALGTGPYFFFCSMRTLVDAHTTLAVNARVVALALGTFLAVAAASQVARGFDPALIAASSYVVATFALAAGIWRALSRSLAESPAPNPEERSAREAALP
jgi:O-antigen/teichoic acid export membrane protein